MTRSPAPRTRSNCGASSALWLTLVLMCLSGPLVQTPAFARQDTGQPGDPAKPKAPDKPVERAGLSFHSLVAGTKLSSESYRPLFVVYTGPPSKEEGDDSAWKRVESQLVSGTKKQLAKFTSVEVKRTSDKATIEMFGGLSRPMIALCDFRGVVLKRWDGDLPSRSAFRKFVKRTWEYNSELAGRFAQAKKSIDKARYALKTDRHKEAVQLYLSTEKLELPADSKPVKELAELRKEIDKKIADRKKKADEKEKKKDYYAAIDILEKTMSDFPIPDVRDELRKKITKLWAKLRGFG